MAETTEKMPRQPGDDAPVSSTSDLTILNATRGYKTEAEDARRTRMKQNAENRRAYMGQQDWSHKTKGQSTEFLPKTAEAVDQFVGFIKRALTQYGAYYNVELGRDSPSPLSGESIRRLIDCQLSHVLAGDNVTTSFPVLLGDAIKVGALESLIILKVHGNTVSQPRFSVEAGDEPLLEGIEPAAPTLKRTERRVWRLRVDVIKTENFYKDPSGAGLYKIHSVERDLYHLKKRAAEGVYEMAAVSKIAEDYASALHEDRRPQEVGQDESHPPAFRKKVRIDECWGTIIDHEGNIVKENVYWVVANDKHLIKKPTKNPFWHGEDPFIEVPLIRVPFSVWHKSLFDHAVQINFAMNELFNLIIDGGISSVWGIKQLHIDALEDPKQVADGIPQGETLLVKSSVPYGANVLEKVVQGEIPGDAMAVLEMLSREFAAASNSNELKMGSMPPKEVRATEVVEMSQSQAVTTDSIVSDIERELIQVFLRKAWLTILQNMDDMASEDVIATIGVQDAFAMAQLSPAERFAMFATGCQFSVEGLSAVLARVRDFQKLMAMLQVVSGNPMLAVAFFKKYSPDKILSHMMKILGLNPEQMGRDETEMARVDTDLADMQAFLASIGGGSMGGPQVSGQDTGDPSLSADINSVSNPTAGLAGAQESR